jgi:hypothetical protein
MREKSWKLEWLCWRNNGREERKVGPQKKKREKEMRGKMILWFQ